eukprot:12020938-Ditylum_brightwellii.AAC.1
MACRSFVIAFAILAGNARCVAVTVIGGGGSEALFKAVVTLALTNTFKSFSVTLSASSQLVFAFA